MLRLDPYPPQDKVPLLWVGANRYLHLVAGRGKTTTQVSYHLREVSERASLGGEARTEQPVKVFSEVTRVVWLMKRNRKIVEQGVVIGFVAGLQRIDRNQRAARLQHPADLAGDGEPDAARQLVQQI